MIQFQYRTSRLILFPFNYIIHISHAMARLSQIPLKWTDQKRVTFKPKKKE